MSNELGQHTIKCHFCLGVGKIIEDIECPKLNKYFVSKEMVDKLIKNCAVKIDCRYCKGKGYITENIE